MTIVRFLLAHILLAILLSHKPLLRTNYSFS
jgi:hypothetical protein